MTKLTKTQRIVLAEAAACEDGAAVAPTKPSKAAAAKIASSLVARKLMREIKAKPNLPVWRRDEAGKPVSLVITRAGRDAIGGVPPETMDRPVSETGEHGEPVASPSPGTGLRAGTKQALIVAMLSEEHGVTLDALIDATGWLPHTARAALTGLRKKGYAIERIGGDGKGRSAYRVVPAANGAA